MKKALSFLIAIGAVAAAGLFGYRNGCFVKPRGSAESTPTSSAPPPTRTVLGSSGSDTGLMKREALNVLRLPVQKTFDLTHVYPGHFAVALNNDPTRIFEFVRDNIGFEPYTGVLRGRRGTLLALAGNSLDRAILLASMLQRSGHQVRYVRGTLPEEAARKLVTSVWSASLRLRPKPEQEPLPAVKAALVTFNAGVHRDYETICRHLKEIGLAAGQEGNVSFDNLVAETRAHYWVQWLKDTRWIDLDSNFTDAVVGRRHTQPEETFDTPPDHLFHRVVIRVRLEEHSGELQGEAEAERSSREVLKYTAKAADLSGMDVVLIHAPENWKGPSISIQTALASAITNTGRIKPILFVGDTNWIAGESFYGKPPTRRGIGGIFTALSGEGTRKSVAIATSEFLEFEFIDAVGTRTSVVREIFDRLGKNWRRNGRQLTGSDVRSRTEQTDDITQNIYSLFFTTGRIDAAHLSGAVEEKPPTEDQPINVPAALRRVHLTFVVSSDSLVGQVARRDGSTVVFYPDSPRVQVLEISTLAGTPRVVIDLRRDHTRAVTMGSRSTDVFFARVLRGVVQGHLERALIDFVSAEARQNGWGPGVSTSWVFERAKDAGLPAVVLMREDPGSLRNVPDETRARIQEDLTNGYLVVAPREGIAVGTDFRLAWWRIDPRSGDTIAMTDEGLHAGPAVGYTGGQQMADGNVKVGLVYLVSPIAGAGGRYVVIWRFVHWIEYLIMTSTLPFLGGD